MAAAVQLTQQTEQQGGIADLLGVQGAHIVVEVQIQAARRGPGDQSQAGQLFFLRIREVERLGQVGHRQGVVQLQLAFLPGRGPVLRLGLLGEPG